ETINIEAKCGTDASLPCNADFRTNEYFSLSWYKNKDGILRIVLKDKQPFNYGFDRNVTLDEQNYSLLLPKVTPADSGRYECAVSAQPGGKNLKLQLELTVPVGTLFNVTHAPHLPLVWSLAGYSAVGLTKIILSMMIIFIIFIVFIKDKWCIYSNKLTIQSTFCFA
uniref:Ig-like domain-containing protein n=1 Tax=Periophthalmus magnuspinnatus TaxID=409849 RepID=A0A3B4AVY2_9GOBI